MSGTISDNVPINYALGIQPIVVFLFSPDLRKYNNGQNEKKVGVRTAAQFSF